MAVLPLNKFVHIVLYERTVPGKGLVFIAYPETYEDWADADGRAKVISLQNKVRAWVAAIEKPSRIQVAK